MKRVSPNRARKREEAVRLERDGTGMTILEVRAWLPKGQASFWPQQQDVDDVSVLESFQEQAIFPFCWLCSRYRTLDVCHIVSRSDEPANLFLACTSDPRKACYPDSCHARTEKARDSLKEILRAKLKYDKPHTSFLRIAQLLRHHYTFDSLD